jgi:hypothetical protein
MAVSGLDIASSKPFATQLREQVIHLGGYSFLAAVPSLLAVLSLYFATQWRTRWYYVDSPFGEHGIHQASVYGPNATYPDLAVIPFFENKFQEFYSARYRDTVDDIWNIPFYFIPVTGIALARAVVIFPPPSRRVYVLQFCLATAMVVLCCAAVIPGANEVTRTGYPTDSYENGLNLAVLITLLGSSTIFTTGFACWADSPSLCKTTKVFFFFLSVSSTLTRNPNNASV